MPYGTYKVLGVYQSNEKDQAGVYGQSPGDFKLQDVNNDGKYTNADLHLFCFGSYLVTSGP